MLKPSLLSSLFSRHQSELKRYVGHKFGDPDAAEDIVQDTFHNILKVENLEEIENPRAYLYQTAHNLAVNRIRRQKRHEDYLGSGVSELETETVALERSVSAERDLKSVQAAVNQLPEKYRKTFLLSRVQAKTYAEISLELGISVSTVEKHIMKALDHLRDQLETEESV